MRTYVTWLLIGLIVVPFGVMALGSLGLILGILK